MPSPVLMHGGQLAKAAPLLLSVDLLVSWGSAPRDSAALVVEQLNRAEFALTDTRTASSWFLAVGFVVCLLPDTSLLSQLGVRRVLQWGA